VPLDDRLRLNGRNPGSSGVSAFTALVPVTAIWGVTFVQIKDALESTGEPRVPPWAPSFFVVLRRG
jgi:hypothetical protein